MRKCGANKHISGDGPGMATEEAIYNAGWRDRIRRLGELEEEVKPHTASCLSWISP